MLQGALPVGRCVAPGAGRSAQRKVRCGDSAQSRHFRHHFDPRGSGQPPETRIFDTPEHSELRQSPEQPPAQHWRRSNDPPGAFQVANPHAQHMRVMPAGIPTPKGALAMPSDEYFYTEVQRDYKRDWPSVDRLPDGSIAFRPGFLETLQDPLVPNYVYAVGIQKLHYSSLDRAVQVGVAAVCAAAAAAAYGWLWAQNYNLAAALLVTWARQRLSVVKMGVLLGLAAVGQLWIYWAFFAASLVDDLLERIAPPLRRWAWMLFNVWMLFLVLSPAHVHPLPFWPFSGFSGAAPMAIPAG